MFFKFTDGTFILADSAYACTKHVIVPYRDNGHLTRAQKNFNKRLSSCRVSVEHAFGALKQRFRQLYHFKLRNIERLVRVIYACCVLHNIANADDLAIFEPPPADQDEHELVLFHDDRNLDENHGNVLRNELCRQLANN